MPFLGRTIALLIALAGTAGADEGMPSRAAEAARPAVSARLPLRIVQGSASARTTSAAARPDEPMRLAPPGAANTRRPGGSAPLTTASAVKTVVTSLAVVLGLLVALVWLSRRANPKARATLPEDIIETLGRAPLSGRQEMHLVRIGNKLLLLSVTPTSAETLTEITDPVEIDRLAGICQQNQPDSITASFREILSHHTNRN
jgi:flagellar biogenesis protein FliO